MVSAKWLQKVLLVTAALAVGLGGCSVVEHTKRIDTRTERIEAEVTRIEQKLDSMLEEPRPVTKDEAVAIAVRFAGLREVTSVTQPRTMPSHTMTINVIGHDGDGEVLVGVSPETGEVIKMAMQCPYPGVDTESAEVSPDEAVRRFQEFLTKRRLPPIPDGFVMGEPKLSTTWRKKHWEITWRHHVDGIEVMPDFVLAVVSAETGAIASYSKVYHDVEVTIKSKLGRDDAIRAARAALGQGNLEEYSPDMDVLSAVLKVLYPNRYFEDFIYHWADGQALAWVVSFSVDREPALDVWVDALTGDILGGEIYERPVPELWGIPNQTGDVTGFWEPALDIMQYSTTHTFLGQANEADIVSSMANGNYFVLHTHGGLTSTAEDAVINNVGTDDQRHLTPDEIPNNNLRYALMSFCHSAHSGTGQDFREALIDRGADVFQGYVESMNPDYYEMSLLRYLAEGQNLWNANRNAKNDVNPWFTIAIEYGPPLDCYNRLRLAPLHVKIDAPSSAGWLAVIKATVRNREDARHTAARHVKAELKLPSGVAIVSGGNPQSRTLLTWNNSWTATWIVMVPFLYAGTKSFDVVVHSQNLGVAVTDYDNPFHRFDIAFKTVFEVVLKEYVAVEEWWEIAHDVFPEYREPAGILAKSDDFDKYGSHEQIGKDSRGFVRLMKSIADMELAFGKHFIPRDTEPPVPVRRYMELVERKMGYLNQLERSGMDDTEKALMDLAALQMELNGVAAEAFLRE